jgi:CBS domain-containing protein
MTVRDIARTGVVTVAPDTAVQYMADLLREEQVGSLVVTDTEEHVIGIVTDRDLGLDVWDAPDPTAVTAGDIMASDPVTVDVDTGVYDALTVAKGASVRRLPVVDGDELYGIVTLDDMIVLLADEFGEVSDVIQAESPPY